jgi:hypothetical protein
MKIPLLFPLLLLSACKPHSADLLDPANSYQDIREQLIRAFLTNPKIAEDDYRKILYVERPLDGNVLVAKLVVCGQLYLNQLPPEHSCSTVIRSGLESSNAEIRSIAVSAIAFIDDDKSSDSLITKLDDPAEIVRFEAAQSLAYKLDNLASDPNNPHAADPLKNSLRPYCASQSRMSTSTPIGVCRKLK